MGRDWRDDLGLRSQARSSPVTFGAFSPGKGKPWGAAFSLQPSAFSLYPSPFALTRSPYFSGVLAKESMPWLVLTPR